MFSPVGYTSLASLWGKFSTKHYVAVYSKAAKYYAGENAALSHQVGTPADICEHLFWNSIFDHAVVVATGDGTVANVTLDLDRQFQSVHHNATVFESMRIASDPLEAGNDAEWLEKFGSVRFVAWKHEHDDAKAWSREFPILSAQELGSLKFEAAPFCTLPFAYERSRFTVPHSLPPWACDAWAKDYIACFVDNFPGWSFCLNDKDLANWCKSADRIVADYVNDGADANAGRPRIVEDVAEQIQSLFPDRNSRPSLKKVNQAVIEKLGREVSLSTVKRAIKTLEKSDQK